MLETLSIRDFAIIDRVDIDLGQGLTVVTGETGAGKSILIDALNLVLGGRGRTEVIRTGAAFAEVEALFDLRTDPGAQERLAEAGITCEDGQLVIRRVIARTGRHRIYLNGNLVTATNLAEVAAGLVDISGQHEHYSLLKTEAHLDLLDRIAALSEPRAAVEAAYLRVAELDKALADLESRQRNRAEREDFLRFQLKELEEAKLGAPDEEATLELESGRLRNVEKLRDAAKTAEQELYTANGAAAARLSKALKQVQLLERLDSSFSGLSAELSTALAVVEDAARTLGHYGDALSSDPDRLEQLQSRLALFTKLRRKHGATLAEVIARRDALAQELATLAGAESSLEALTAARAEAGQALLDVAGKLSAARKTGAAQLARAVKTELGELDMGGATLVVEVAPATTGLDVAGHKVGSKGQDRVTFLLSANPGEAPQPLNRIASGGELSRFMLAVKRVIAERDSVGTYVFDEVDSGVGGPTAEAIGRKLESVSRTRQAICITHMPQIAALGHHHLKVAKRIDGERTRSEVSPLDERGRVEELSRMLGGREITQKTREHAAEMLSMAARLQGAPTTPTEPVLDEPALTEPTLNESAAPDRTAAADTEPGRPRPRRRKNL